MEFSPQNNEKILIVRLSSLGDVLLTTPLIRSIKKKFPNSELHFLIKKNFKDVIIHNPHLDKILIYEDEIKLEDNIPKNYEYLIDLQNNFRSGKLRKKFKGKIYRFKKNSIKKFLLVRFKINLLKEEKKIPERYAEAIPNFELDGEGLEIFEGNEIKARVETADKLIGIAPGAKHYTKRWPIEKFISLAQELLKLNYKVAVIGGKDDKEICGEIIAKAPGVIDLTTENELLQLAADMKNLSAVVTNDSAMTHLACAVKTPVVALFGSTVEEFGFFPYKNKSVVVENKELVCRPCSHIGRASCPKKHFKCMIDLNAEEVLRTVKKLINE